MKFPNIDYEFWLQEWNNSIGKEKVYTNKNLIKYIQFQGNTTDCTEEIFRLVRTNQIDKKTILKVTDLIYSWGGKSSRMFYANSNNQISNREHLEHDSEAIKTYIKGIELAKKGDSACIKEFQSIRGIGPSYASKHSYFWSIESPSPLLIVDSKIAGVLGFKTIEDLNKKHSYQDIVNAFVKKSKLEFGHNNPSDIERAIFAFHNFYFLNNNAGWKNKIMREDYEEALRIARVLFEKPHPNYKLTPHLLNIATENIKNQKWEKAINAYQVILDVDYENIEALQGISICYRKIGNINKAEFCLNQANELKRKKQN